MSKLLIRHSISKANDRNNIGNLAFASPDTSLMPKGRAQATGLKAALLSEYGIDTATTPAACSKFLRAIQTTELAGFRKINRCALLNEVEHGVELPILRQMLDEGEVPAAAIPAAERLLENPPEERIWVTHGLVIIGLYAVLGLQQTDTIVPKFGEIREIPVG